MDAEDQMPSTSQRERRLTYEDFVHFPDDGKRHELIDGVHYVTPSPVRQHQRLVRRLLVALSNFVDAHPGCGEVFGAPFDTVFSQSDVVEPDLLFVAGDQLDILTEPNVQGAPALVVEVLSPGTRKRDLGVKRQLYDRGGVREYWVVDPKGRDLTVYRRTPEGSFPKVAQLSATEDDTLTTPVLPGFTLSLAKLFA